MQLFTGTAFAPMPPVHTSSLSKPVTGEYLSQVIWNGEYCAKASQCDTVPKGMLFKPFSQVSASKDDIAKALVKTSMARSALPEQKADNTFTHLNTALTEEGIVFHLGQKVQEADPVVIRVVTSDLESPAVSHPRIVIALESDSKAHVYVVISREANKALSWTNLVMDVTVAEFAQLNLTILDCVEDDALCTTQTQVTLASEARLNLTTVSLGSGNKQSVSRHDLRAIFAGERCNASLNGLNVIHGQARVHHNTVMDHQVPHCDSSQLYKGILDDESVSEFIGTIFVRQPAQQTNAQQLNKNLVFSDEARVLTRPQLAIEADDVKCAHGATVGQLEDAELFYLASRGIGPEQARHILTHGFADEIVSQIAHPAIASAVETELVKTLRL
jgi:Fe-S cluster assembly protein SufD